MNDLCPSCGAVAGVVSFTVLDDGSSHEEWNCGCRIRRDLSGKITAPGHGPEAGKDQVGRRADGEKLGNA